MAANTNPVFELTPVHHGVTFTDADTTTAKSGPTGATDGTRIDQLIVTSDDTAAITLKILLNNGGTNYRYGTVTIPAGTGITAAAMECMAALSPTLGYILVPSGYILKYACTATMTAGKTLTVLAQGGDF